jgi:hypothetical protein
VFLLVSEYKFVLFPELFRNQLGGCWCAWCECSLRFALDLFVGLQRCFAWFVCACICFMIWLGCYLCLHVYVMCCLTCFCWIAVFASGSRSVLIVSLICSCKCLCLNVLCERALFCVLSPRVLLPCLIFGVSFCLFCFV